MSALRRSALLAVLLAACGQPAAPATVAKAEPAAPPAAAPAAPAPAKSEPLSSDPGARPDEALCTRFADHVGEVMVREDPSTKAAVTSMRAEMIARCTTKITRGEIECGLAATNSVDMDKCRKG
jgi:hypothetical protein